MATQASSNFIQSPGPYVILGPTTAISTGSWFRVHPKMVNWAFGINQTGSSLAATVTSSGVIEVSYDSITAAEEVIATWSLDGTAGGSPGAAVIGIASSMQGQYPFIRARMVSINGSSVGAAGSPGGVTVTMSCQSQSA